MKKIFSVLIILTVSAAMALSGCGNQGKEAETEASANAEVTKEAEKSTPQPTKEGTEEPVSTSLFSVREYGSRKA